MEKTLQVQYNLIKEGKGDKAYFLKSAYRLFPDMLSQVNSFEDTTRILKNRGVISEGIGGLVTSGKKQDWHTIFNENMDKLKEEDKDEELARRGDEEMQGKEDSKALPNIGSLKEGKEDPSKEVTDIQKHAYDNKDEKNYDNLFGQEFLDGYYTEMKDPKNADKDVEELRAIVAKNLAKDISYYVKNGQFGVKGLGYQTEAPGLGEPKEAKGKFKSSGYGDLKESVLRLVIQDLIKEVLTELTGDEAMEVNKNSIVHYKKDGKEVSSKYISQSLNAGEPLPVFKLENGDEVYAGDVIKLSEALNKDSIKEEGESAKKEAMKKRITNEIVKRKKQRKALQTLTELDEEVNEGNAKKLKELQSEIKQLEGMAAKLDGKKKKDKEVDESLFDLNPTDPTDKPVVATSPTAKAAITKAGGREIPGTKDVK
jgi:hypothetical protein